MRGYNTHVMSRSWSHPASHSHHSEAAADSGQRNSRQGLGSGPPGGSSPRIGDAWCVTPAVQLQLWSLQVVVHQSWRKSYPVPIQFLSKCSKSFTQAVCLRFQLCLRQETSGLQPGTKSRIKMLRLKNSRWWLRGLLSGYRLAGWLVR